jgi:hypothetical protein
MSYNPIISLWKQQFPNETRSHFVFVRRWIVQGSRSWATNQIAWKELSTFRVYANLHYFNHMSNLSLLFIFLSELNRKEVDVITIPDKETTVVIILYYALTRVVEFHVSLEIRTLLRPCYTVQFFMQLVSQLRCETSCTSHCTV